MIKLGKKVICISPIPNRQILDSTKLKELTDDNYKFDGNGGNSTKGLKTLWEKETLLVTSNVSFSHSVFNRLVLQTRENKGLFGKELKGGFLLRLQNLT